MQAPHVVQKKKLGKDVGNVSLKPKYGNISRKTFLRNFLNELLIEIYLFLTHFFKELFV
jgi:hypothetical protein